MWGGGGPGGSQSAGKLVIQALGERGNLLILPPLSHLETECTETELHLLCSNSTCMFTQEGCPSPFAQAPRHTDT